MPYQGKTAEAFEAGIRFLEEAHRVLIVAVRGIASLRGVGHLTEALAEYDRGEGKPVSDDAVKKAHELARLAVQEVESDFPLLHAHTVVAMWSTLETLIPNFAAAWLVEFPETLERSEFERVQVPVALLREQDDHLRMAAVISDLTERTASSLKPGVGQFQEVLKALGLGFGISDELRRDLFELSQVRNLIVHRLSVVDQKFARECPWLGLKIGDRLKITSEMYLRYHKAIMTYLTELINHAKEKKRSIRTSSEPSSA